jgi:hypothetical protein
LQQQGAKAGQAQDVWQEPVVCAHAIHSPLYAFSCYTNNVQPELCSTHGALCINGVSGRSCMQHVLPAWLLPVLVCASTPLTWHGARPSCHLGVYLACTKARRHDTAAQVGECARTLLGQQVHSCGRGGATAGQLMADSFVATKWLLAGSLIQLE